MMKRIFLIMSAAIAALALASCVQNVQEETEAPYFDVAPANLSEIATTGDGDGIVVSIKTNVGWTLSSDAEWLKFESTQGTGSADVFGAVLRGSLTDPRDCNVTVTPASGYGFSPVTLKVQQGKFVPITYELTLDDVLASAKGEGEAAALLDYSYTNVVVASPAGAENCLSDPSDMIVSYGPHFLRAAIPGSTAFKLGDTLRLELTEGTITKEADGGYFLKVAQNVVSSKAGPANFEPVVISCSSVASYPYALVRIPSCQATDDFVGKTWGTSAVTMDMIAIEEGDFSISVDPKASFASQAVPSLSGTVTGFAIGGKLLPRSAADLGLTAKRGKKYVKGAYNGIKPIINILKYGGSANTYSNITKEGNTKVVFTDSDYSVAGASITMPTSSAIAYVVAAASPFQCCYTTKGWEVGKSYYLYEVPIQELTWGDLDFNFSVSHGTAANLPWKFEVTWSTDGVNFKPVDAVSGLSPHEYNGNVITQKTTAYADTRYCAEFSIPESQALNAGDKIYVKYALVDAVNCTTALTVRLNIGFYLCTRPTNETAPDLANVLTAENFETCNYGCDLVMGGPVDYFSEWTTAGNWSSPSGWTVSGARASRKCMLFNSGECAAFSPALEKLTAPSDITVTFKLCLYTYRTRDNNASPATANLASNIHVEAVGGGTAGEIVWDTNPEEDYFSWHTGTCKISGATSSTSVAIKGNATQGQFLLKDVVVTK